MLLSFTVKNFRSFKNAQSLIMTPQKRIKDHPENIGVDGKYEALKSVAILGHNASGKSNLIEAFFIMKRMFFLFSPFRNVLAASYEPFSYNKNTSIEPTEFEIEFLFKEKKYRYGFSYDDEKVVSEWLFSTFNKPRAREQLLFIRENNNYSIGNFKGSSRLKEKTDKINLFLAVCAIFNVEEAKLVREWFYRYVFFNRTDFDSFNNMTTSEKIAEALDNKKLKRNILKFLNNADLSIQDIYSKKNKIKLNINIKKIIKYTSDTDDTDETEPNEILQYTIYSTHNVYNDKNMIIDKKGMDFIKTESSGTIKYLGLSMDLLNVLSKGGIFIVDELDSKLHPLLFLNIIKLFNSKETNPNNAQLILTTHNPAVLDKADMRRDQILFVEKDSGEASKIYPLSQFRVGKRKSFAESYLFGRFGAIPALSNLADNK